MYSSNDGTIEFYGRINSILAPDMHVLDLGAGRAGWFEDDPCAYRKGIRLLTGKVAKVIATDVDPAVLKNRACDRALVMEGNTIPLPDASIDMIVADWVLEHVDDPNAFHNEVNRVLRPGGYFCARTPHGFSYLSMFARLIANSSHSRLLRKIQPSRKAEDVFPTRYRINSLTQVRKHFSSFEDYSYIFRPDPAYYFGSMSIYYVLEFLHRIFPAPLSGCLYVFLRKSKI